MKRVGVSTYINLGYVEISSYKSVFNYRARIPENGVDTLFHAVCTPKRGEKFYELEKLPIRIALARKPWWVWV